MRLGSWQICEEEDWESVTCQRTLMDGGKKITLLFWWKEDNNHVALNWSCRVSWYSKETHLDEGSGGVNVLDLEINRPVRPPPSPKGLYGRLCSWQSPAGVALLCLIHVSMMSKEVGSVSQKEIHFVNCLFHRSTVEGRLWVNI